jgi:hypothetical protein
MTRRPVARLQGRRVLFIDFDGVLHPDPALDCAALSSSVGHFGWLAALVEILKPHPDVAVVVHSSWREVYNEPELKDILSELGSRVLGATPIGARYESILRWLADRPEFTSVRILDDDISEFPSPIPDELIVCDPNHGVTDGSVKVALRDWLGK